MVQKLKVRRNARPGKRERDTPDEPGVEMRSGPCVIDFLGIRYLEPAAYRVPRASDIR